MWAHTDFSTLIAVDADPWVGVSVFRATSAESALADRLYANVQMRLILEEYERMQQRAREVLEGRACIFSRSIKARPLIQDPEGASRFDAF